MERLACERCSANKLNEIRTLLDTHDEAHKLKYDIWYGFETILEFIESERIKDGKPSIDDIDFEDTARRYRNYGQCRRDYADARKWLTTKMANDWLYGKELFTTSVVGIISNSYEETCNTDNEERKLGRKEKLSMEVFKNEIYPEMKKQFPDSKHIKGKKAYCAAVGKKYGVSEKTIRDKFDTCNMGE